MARSPVQDAIYAVLRDARRPMRVADIHKAVVEKGLISHSATEGSIRSTLYDALKARRRVVRMSEGWGLKEWEHSEDPVLAALSTDDLLVRGLRRWVRSLRAVRSQTQPLPSADTLCLWVEFCERLELIEDACGLFELVNPEEANSWLFDRARSSYRRCQNIQIAVPAQER